MRLLSVKQLAGMNCHYIRYSLDYFLDSMVQGGFENMELWGAVPHYYADYFTLEMVRALKKKIRDRGLQAICLTCEQVTYPINVAAKETYLRNLSVNQHLRTLEHAAEMEIPMMLMTPGTGCWDEDREEAWKRSADSIARVARRAEELGVTIALEHLSPGSSNLINTAADLRRMLDEVFSPRLKAMFDLGQVNIVGEKVRDYFELLGEDIVHIHLVDGVPGGHLALGDGTIPLEENLRDVARYGYDGYLSLEIADRRYFSDPQAADRKSVEMFQKLAGALSIEKEG